MHIGIAGTGKMGAAMAVRLQSLGHQVTVWNRTRQRAQALLDALAIGNIGNGAHHAQRAAGQIAFHFGDRRYQLQAMPRWPAVRPSAASAETAVSTFERFEAWRSRRCARIKA